MKVTLTLTMRLTHFCSCFVPTTVPGLEGATSLKHGLQILTITPGLNEFSITLYTLCMFILAESPFPGIKKKALYPLAQPKVTLAVYEEVMMEFKAKIIVGNWWEISVNGKD